MSEIAVIQRKIYEVRGQKVILDRDLAALYQVETRVLNQAVKRNIERFPEDFMFQLTKDEWKMISSQIVTTSPDKRPLSALPYVFTEHGVVATSIAAPIVTGVAIYGVADLGVNLLTGTSISGWIEQGIQQGVNYYKEEW